MYIALCVCLYLLHHLHYAWSQIKMTISTITHESHIYVQQPIPNKISQAIKKVVRFWPDQPERVPPALRGSSCGCIKAALAV